MAAKKYKTLTEEDYEKIINERLIFNRPVAKIAEEIGCCEDRVSNVTSVFTVCQHKDFEAAVDLIRNRNFPLDMFSWACKRLDIDLPRPLVDAYEQRKEADRKKHLEKKARKTAAEKPVEQKPAEPSKNDAIYFCRLLQEIEKQNELLTQLMDVVIPHWIGDLKENNNVNTDLLNKQLQLIDQKVECIKVNTRKRGL